MSPFNDYAMTYDKSRHRYILTTEDVLVNLNINLHAELRTNGLAADEANEADKLLDRVSRIVYQHIYSHASRPRKMERRLALDPGLRDIIREAMEEQLLYILANGDYTNLSGINTETGAAHTESIRAATVSPLAGEILMNAGLLFVGIDWLPDIIPDYEEGGY